MIIGIVDIVMTVKITEGLLMNKKSINDDGQALSSIWPVKDSEYSFVKWNPKSDNNSTNSRSTVLVFSTCSLVNGPPY
jgi:hypothetical protein